MRRRSTAGSRRRDAQGFVAVERRDRRRSITRARDSSASRWRSRRAMPATSRSATIAEGPDALALAAQTKGLKQIPLREALAKLKPLLEDPSVLKIGHNIKFDIGDASRATASRVGAGRLRRMLISFVLEGGRHGHELDELATLHFGHETIKYKDVAGTRQEPYRLCRGAAREGARLRRRGRRLRAAASSAAEAAAASTTHLLGFYETVERPLVPRRRRDGARRHPRRPRRAQRAVATISRSASPSSKPKSTSSPATPSTSARPSNWARCCSTS